MSRKNKIILLSLQVITPIISSVVVVACSSEEIPVQEEEIPVQEETPVSILEDLQKDSSSLGEILGTRAGQAFPFGMAADDIATVLKEVGGLD